MLTKEEVINYLLPSLNEVITPCIQEAFEYYRHKDTMSPNLRRLMSPRSRTNVIYDIICDMVTHKLEQERDLFNLPPINMKVYKKCGSLRILCGDQVRIIFKKVGQNRKPSFNKTFRQSIYNNHGFDPKELDNMPPKVTNTYYAWQWQPVGECGLFLLCPEGDTIKWEYELLQTPGTPTEVQLDIPATDNHTKRVKPKKSIIKNLPKLDL